MSARRTAWLALLLLFGCDDGRVRAPADGSTPTADGGAPPVTCELPAPIACAMDLGATMPVALTASTAGGSNAHGGPSCGGGAAADAWFVWTAPRAGRYDISTAGTGFDSVLTVLDGASCDGGSELACNDDVSGSRQARLTIELAECQTITIVVDGFRSSDAGGFSLAITGRESSCDDGVDDDGDGLTDCDDVDDCRIRECIEDGDWPQPWADLEWRVLELTNQNRARGATCADEAFGPAPALEMDEVIRIAARLHSQDMGAQDYFEHDSLDGRTFADRMREVGFRGASPWGENIAAGQPTAERVVQGWMESPGHCRNIMNPDYRVIGIGYAFDDSSSFGHYWTQDFAASH